MPKLPSGISISQGATGNNLPKSVSISKSSHSNDSGNGSGGSFNRDRLNRLAGISISGGSASVSKMSPINSPSNSNGDGKTNALAKLSQLNVSISGSDNSSPQSTPSRSQAPNNQRKSKLQWPITEFELHKNLRPILKFETYENKLSFM